MATAACALLLSACGGGGGDGGAALGLGAGGNAAEGYWAGTLARERADFIILEDGSTWGVQTGAAGISAGLHGASAIEGGRYSARLTRYGYADGSFSESSYTGDATPRSRIDATASGAGALQLRYDANYEQPAHTSRLAGRYALDANTVLAISSAGDFNWIEKSDCILSGQIVPRASGRNVFDFSATYVGSGCVHGDRTRIAGVAVLDTLSSPSRFVSMARRSDGWLGFASRAVRLDEPVEPAPSPGPSPTPTPTPTPTPEPEPTPIDIARGHYPPAGMCRIWIPGLAPGQQSPPGDCAVLELQVPPGAVLIRG